jgi:probable F420-dependent oxidoreductase
MKFSFQLPLDKVRQPDQFITGEAVTQMAQALEAAGFDACYVTDHPIPSDPWLQSGGHHTVDPFVALSFAAAATSKLRLHTNLIVVPYRNPFLVAKSIASLDVLSGGRVIMGLGSGYLEGEFEALGATFQGRGAVMDEAIEVMKLAWTGSSIQYSGRFFKAAGNTALPAPAQRPHPPMWVGGNSDRAMRRAAETLDGWSPFPVRGRMSERVRTDVIANLDDLSRKIGELRRMAEQARRTRPLDVAFVPFSLTMQKNERPNADSVVEELIAYIAAGVTWCVVALPCDTRSLYLENVDWFAREVIARVPA